MTVPLLTARQVGDLLGIAPGTVLRWTRAGELPAFKLPSGAVRYDGAEVEAWLRGRSTSAGAALSPATTTDADLPATLPSVASPATTEEE